MKKYTCSMCGAEKSGNDSVCLNCGKVLLQSYVAYGFVEGNTVKRLPPGQLYITDKRLIIGNSDMSFYAFGLVGAVVGELTKPKDQKAAARYSLLSDIENIVHPIEKYGTVFNNVKGDNGIRIDYKNGTQIVLRLDAKKAAEVVELLNTLIRKQPIPKESASPLYFKCPHCGVTQLREGAFCSFCGKPTPDEPVNAQNTEQNGEISATIGVCPVCGNRQEADKNFCANCGHPMGIQLPPKQVCPVCGAKIEGKALFCMECGMKL